MTGFDGLDRKIARVSDIFALTFRKLQNPHLSPPLPILTGWGQVDLESLQGACEENGRRKKLPFF
jgi:hypothetical protein